MRYLLLLFCFTLSAVQAQSVNSRSIDSIMQVANARGIFNGNVLVAQKGRVIYQQSFGYADAGRRKKITSDLRFDIGSVSKEFNSTGIMILKERGLLKLDDPISKFLPGLPAWASKVKVRKSDYLHQRNTFVRCHFVRKRQPDPGQLDEPERCKI
jgi:CubicO group peptidase (beta-lactamase class C family)